MTSVYEGIIASVGLTGIKPLKKPMVCGMIFEIGTHGLSKVEATTE